MNIYYIGKTKYGKFVNVSLEECYNYLSDKDVISLDIETTEKFGGKYADEGLDPRLSEIVMVQLGDLYRQYVIDYRDIKTLGPKILSLLTDKNKIIVGQNIKFEYKHILDKENIRINNLYDTMIAEQILYCGLNVSASLKELNKRYLGIEVDKSTRLEFKKIKSKKFTIKQIEYGAEDVLYPLQIREIQLEKLAKQGLERTMALEMLFLPVLGDMEYKGIHFNKQKWEALAQKKQIEKNIILNILIQNILEALPKNSKFRNTQLDLFSSSLDIKDKLNISFDSPQQVIELFKELEICPIAKSKTTGIETYTVDATVLNSQRKALLNKFLVSDRIVRNNIIDNYLIYKELQKSCTTYGEDFFKYIHPITGRIHSDFKQILNTGRISSRYPNLQNIPSEKDYRECFDTDDQHKIINADYSGQEQIILVNKSKEENLIKFYESGENDMHSYVARMLFFEIPNELPLSRVKQDFPEKRQIAKAAGFAINYGGNGYTIAKNLGIDQSVGDEVYDSYFKAFPGLQNYFIKVQNETIRNGYILIDNLTRRKSYYDKSKFISKIKRDALNYPIQGTAGSITKFAAVLFRNWILEQGLEDKVAITNLVHDEINVECDFKYALDAAKKLEECMEHAGSKWCKIVPLKAEAHIGDFWYH